MKYILKKISAMIFAVHLLLNFNYAFISEKDDKSEVYEIYSVVLDSLYSQLDDIHISGRTMEYNISDSSETRPSLEVFLENFSTLRYIHCLEALEDFYYKQNERFYFEEMFSSKTPVTIVPIDKNGNYSVDDENQEFKSFLFFTSIGFNKAKTEAVLCVVRYKVSVKWIYLRKHQDKWEIIAVD